MRLISDPQEREKQFARQIAARKKRRLLSLVSRRRKAIV
jgi:hypothetical protein